LIILDIEATELWGKVLEKLKSEIIKPIFDTWIKPTFAVKLTETSIVIRTPEEFIKDWIEARYLNEINSVLRSITNKPLSAIFIYKEVTTDNVSFTRNKTLEYYMSLPWKIILYPAKKGGYVAEIPKLPGCLIQGETKHSALDMIEDAKAAWIEIAMQDSMTIPEPAE
jgi:antitoxin HicB